MSERKARLMDSARKALSSLSHYEYEECEVGYMFSTEIGNVYLVTFTEYPLISDLVETTLYIAKKRMPHFLKKTVFWS